ncbi:MAG: flagellar motor switch protein FliN [Chitinivibrionales bacterium]|nr:flagellar motor switch protein FliN [Chitinivibrionales bacterium]
MSEPLSEDQINDLLSQDTGEGISADSLDMGGGNDSGGEKNYDTLQKTVELFNNHAQNVLTTVLNKQIGFEITRCEKTDTSAIQETVSGDLLSIKITAEGAVSGDLFLVITKNAVAVLSDLMMMGDGTAEYVDDHKDAISELASQMINPFGVELGEKFGESVSFGNIEVQECDSGSLPFDSAASDMALLNVTVEGMEGFTIAMVLSDEISGAMIARQGSANEGSGEEKDLDEGIGLSADELNDLASVSSDFDGGDSFQESPLMDKSSGSKSQGDSVDMLMDVDLDVSIELGRTSLSIKRILELAPGSIVELDRMAGEPVDLMVNNKVVAKGEVVVVDENFGIRIVSLVSAEDRIRSLR